MVETLVYVGGLVALYGLARLAYYLRGGRDWSGSLHAELMASNEKHAAARKALEYVSLPCGIVIPRSYE